MKINNKLTAKDLERIKALQIKKAKAFLGHTPFANNVYLALKTGLSIQFIKDNQKEIFS